MIVGVAVLPTAPVLVPGVSATLPDGLPRVCDAIDAAVEALPPRDLTVLVAAGDGGVHDTDEASLRGVGRPDIRADIVIAAEAAAEVGAATEYPVHRGGALPLGLTVLALHLGQGAAVVPLTVPEGADFAALVGLGASVAGILGADDVRAGVVVAGDLSAALTERSPRHYVSSAIFWDEQAVAAVDSSRLDALGRLGPGEASRVGALGWAPLSVLHGVVAATKIGMVVRHYSAPRGVGYLVAAGG